MKKEEVKICIIRVGGTNCDRETKRSFKDLGVKAEVKHFNRLVEKNSLQEFDGLVIPGGFSFGDYVRAGAILAKSLTARLRRELELFIDEGKPILGICNGFQVLVEAGLLPGFNGISDYPEAALATNIPIGYRCMWVYLRHENSGRCIFTRNIPQGDVLRIPVAHAEGRFIFPREEESRLLERLLENDQLVFRYCLNDGRPAEGAFPENPNGAFYDIAGICDPSGTIFGLMPHPERAFYGWQLPDWTRMRRLSKFADGRAIFSSMIEYITRKF